MRETWAERKERERVRDQLREWGIECAEWTSVADLNSIERTGKESPRVRFWRPVVNHRHSCGMVMTPLPVPSKRFGYLVKWFCPFCGLDELVTTALDVYRAAQEDPA